MGPEERAAVRVLTEELGRFRALQVGFSVQVAALRGQPFGGLPRAVGKEKGSRDQAGPIVLLYRALQRRVGDDEALRIMGRLVEESSLAFLTRTVGRLDRARIEAMGAEERERMVKDTADGFPNATMEWKSIAPEQVVFEITACRIVELVTRAGHPELAPLFCAADRRYFGEVEEGTELIRPTTIAEGHDRCRFTIRFSD